jgi:hypothetical protein
MSVVGDGVLSGPRRVVNEGVVCGEVSAVMREWREWKREWRNIDFGQSLLLDLPSAPLSRCRVCAVTVIT